MPKFGRRHYKAVADAMKEANRSIYYDDNDKIPKAIAKHQWEACISALVWAFSRDNSRFDETRFKEACEP